MGGFVGTNSLNPPFMRKQVKSDQTALNVNSIIIHQTTDSDLCSVGITSYETAFYKDRRGIQGNRLMKTTTLKTQSGLPFLH